MKAELDPAWLGELALRGGALLAVVLLLGLGLWRLPAARRYGFWLAGLAGLVVMPLAMLWGPAWRVLPKLEHGQKQTMPAQETAMEETETEPALDLPEERMAVSGQAEAALEVVSGDDPAPSVSMAAPQAEARAWEWDWRGVAAWLPWLWLAGVAAGLGRLGVNAWRLRRLRRAGEVVWDRAAPAVVAEVAAALELRRLPKVMAGAADAVPMVWGVRRPCLLLPRGFEQWPEAKLRAVLLHELAHLARRDPLALWVGQMARALHWFNPLAWLTLRRLRADQERACDDTVLRHGVRASDYAQFLLDLSRQRRPAAGLSLCALAMARPGPVEERVVAILDAKRSRAGASRAWWSLWTLACLGLAVPLAVLQAVEEPKKRGQIVDRNGVVLAETLEDGRRTYPHENLAAHTIGWGGLHFQDSSFRGHYGIEKRKNADLTEGKEVKLTLDARLQQLAEDELAASNHSGAVVVLDVETGEALALVSQPDFDLNVWLPNIEPAEFERLRDDPEKPLFPRATSSTYQPSTVFQLVTAMAGLASGYGDAVFHCEDRLLIDGRTFHSHSKSDVGEFDLERAIIRSHYVYFYQLAMKLGHEPLANMAGKLGFGEKTGMAPEQEASGRFPPYPLTGKRQDGNMSNRELANLSIGYGDITVTPLQMAQLAAVIASRGKVGRPILVLGEHKGKLEDLGLSDADWNLLHRTISCDVPGGVNSYGRSDLVRIAMKAGTTELRQRKKLASVIGFAPMEKPRIAFAVLLEGRPEERVSGGRTAAPVAKRIVEGWLVNGDSAQNTPDLSEIWSLAGMSKSGTEPYTVRLRHRQTGEFVKIKEGETHDDFRVVEVHYSRLRYLTKVVVEQAGKKTALGYDIETAKRMQEQAEPRKEGYWTVKKHDDLDYVPLREVASFYRFDEVKMADGLFSMSSPNFEFFGGIGDSGLILNRVKLAPSHPVVEMDGELWMSRMTLSALIEPILRPQLDQWKERLDTVIIDTGSGAANANAQPQEDFADRFSWKTALALKKRLEEAGIRVVMTREETEFAADEKRVQKINEVKGGVVLALGIAKQEPGGADLTSFALVPPASLRGTEMEAPLRSQSLGLAVGVYRETRKAIGGLKGSVTNARWTMLEGCARPGMVALFGHPETDEEKERAMSEAFQARLAKGLAEGVRTFLKVSKKQAEGTDGRKKKEEGDADSGDSASAPSASDRLDRLVLNPVEKAAMDANTERRWRMVREEGGLADLPEGAKEMRSALVGSLPRSVQVQFEAPRKEVLWWLEFSAGRVREAPDPRLDYELIAETARNETTVDPLEDLKEGERRIINLNYRLAPNWQERAWVRIRENLGAMKEGYLGDIECRNGVSVKLSAKNEGEVEVTIAKRPNHVIKIAE